LHSYVEGTSATPSDDGSWTQGVYRGISRNMRRKSGRDQGIGRAGEGRRVTREDRTVGVAQYVIASPWAH
ncbi:MAG TPA: hypothetical protein VJQ25_11345, partial [Nitrospira sp.]|nr:hypothetical protein [Nitrospira sp.]